MAQTTELYPHIQGQVVRKTVTFNATAGNGDAGSVALFTITGRVQVLSIAGFCTTLLTETGGTATIALGITGSTSLFIGATGAIGIDANEWWVSTTPTAAGLALPAACQNIVIAADIIATIATADIDAGVIEFVVWYRPISEGSALVAA